MGNGNGSSVLSDQRDLPASHSATVRLSALGRGARGRIGGISLPEGDEAGFGIAPDELERRLLEIGFVEGARIEILHEGLVGRDPIVVMVDGTRVALRRRDAKVVLVLLDSKEPVSVA